jgi:stage II sporulation protein D
MATRSLIAALAVAALSAGAATSTPLPSSTLPTGTLVITGHGFGHGVGMGQWGAYGYALHGWAYQNILGHYYTGTTIGKPPQSVVKVLLAAGKRKVTVGSASAWQVVDGKGTALALPAGPLVIPASLQIDGVAFSSPITFSPGASPVQVGKRSYHGALQVVSDGKRVQVVNIVDLESYVEGVVPNEMPPTWPAAALEAQAVASRSFALAQARISPATSAFDLYSDSRSQVYGGIDAEKRSVTKAVEATAGQVVLYHGNVATTYFSSSTGGETVAATDGDGDPIPYLVSVRDPYDKLSPDHSWGPVILTAETAGKALGLGGPLLDLERAGTGSGHVVTATATGPNGTVTLSGAKVATALGLRSTWFKLGWLALMPPSAPVPAGVPVTIDGTARSLPQVTLQAKPDGGTWQPVGAVAPDKAGAFSIQVTPQVTTSYRLASGRVRAGMIEVQVGGAGALVTAEVSQGGVAGKVNVSAPGAPLFLDRKVGRGWITVATATVPADGTFAFRPPLPPGTYRVRCRPGHGIAPGASSVLSVDQ